MVHPFWILIQAAIGCLVIVAVLVRIESVLEWLERKL